nr:hypothetical protein [Tanacetum cinerariifolium]
MPPKRTSTSEAPAMTQTAIRKLVVDSVATALKTQAATMANADNANRNPKPREAPVAKKCSYKEFMCNAPLRKEDVMASNIEPLVSPNLSVLSANPYKGKFDRKADDGFLVGYSVPSKAFRVFNSRTRIVQKTLHINFLEKQPNVVGSRPTWLFDIDTLTQSMNYQPVVVGNQPNSSTGIQEHFDADTVEEGNVQKYVLFPLWSFGFKDPQNTDANVTFEVKEPEFEVHVSPSSSAKTKKHDDKTKREAKGKSPVELSTGLRNLGEEFKDLSSNSTNGVNAASTPITAVEPNSTNNTNTYSAAGPSNTVVSSNFELDVKSSYVDPSQYLDDPNMPALEDITYLDNKEDVGAEADISKLETNITISPILTTRVHKYHPVTQINKDLSSAPQTRSMTRMVKEQGGLTQINNDDFHTCKFACFLSQKKPKRVHQALKDPSLIEAMQEELLQFKMQKVWVLVDLPKGKRAIGSKWVFRNKNDEKSIVIRNKARLVAQGFEDPGYPDKVYKVVKALYGLHQALRAWYETLANYLLKNDLCKAFEKLMKHEFQMSSMGKLTFFLGLQVKQKQDEIFISQDKYVAKILRKFGLTDGKSASTPNDTKKPLLKDPNGEDVDVHTYRLMIGSLMYLTSSRLDIMFAVCACAHFHVTPKASHLHAVKRIFRYLKGKPHLGLWYPKDSPFNLVAYSGSDYAGASLDRKSTKGGCQFLGYRLISWQCRKQTVVGTSSTDVTPPKIHVAAEY